MAAEVSVILSAYRSHDTLRGCLESLLRQTFQDFETIVVDSSPDEATAHVAMEFPAVRLERSLQRLYPHAARNLGAKVASGNLLVFMDPDVYAHPGWLETLVAAYRVSGNPIVGALACYGDRLLDQGIHLCKFSKWLPGGPPRPVDMSPTANMLISREAFEAVGGFVGDLFLGDALLSWQLRQGGATLWFEPRAVVEHHHLSTFRGFLRERYRRGILFGELRAGWSHHDRVRNLLYLAVSMPPIRLLRILPLTACHASRAGQLGRFLLTLPLTLAGHTASLAGEAVAYGRLLLRPQQA